MIKLDMSKAFDRMEWNFIEAVIQKMGFANQWIDKIMGCFRTIKHLVKCNNHLSDTIFPERGLRQGDPLSPYLFLFCMEAFSRMLIHAQNNNSLRGIRASINGPRINHLFFTDDALLFVRNKKMMLIALLKFLEILPLFQDKRLTLRNPWFCLAPILQVIKEKYMVTSLV